MEYSYPVWRWWLALNDGNDHNSHDSPLTPHPSPKDGIDIICEENNVTYLSSDA